MQALLRLHKRKNLKKYTAVIGQTEDLSSEPNEEQKVELEDQFILRLPPAQAEAVRNALKQLKPKKLKKFLSISLNPNKKEIRVGTVKVKKHQLNAELVDLPCIVESYKMTDKSHLFKTADICQMLVCQQEKTSFDKCFSEMNSKTKNTKYLYPHGVTPPLKNVRRERFRKVLKNKANVEEVAEIEKEVCWLLRADNEAVSTKFEVYYEEPQQITVNEHTIFGELIEVSDNEETPQSSAKSSTSELNEYVKISPGE